MTFSRSVLIAGIGIGSVAAAVAIGESEPEQWLPSVADRVEGGIDKNAVGLNVGATATNNAVRLDIIDE